LIKPNALQTQYAWMEKPQNFNNMKLQTGLSEQDLAGIRAFFKVHDEYVLSADWANVASQYTDDAIRFPPGGDPIKGKIEIQEGLEVVEKYTAFTTEKIEIDGHGDIAYALAEFSATFILVGSTEPMAISGRSLVVLKKQADNSWKLFRVMWN